MWTPWFPLWGETFGGAGGPTLLAGEGRVQKGPAEGHLGQEDRGLQLPGRVLNRVKGGMVRVCIPGRGRDCGGNGPYNPSRGGGRVGIKRLCGGGAKFLNSNWRKNREENVLGKFKRDQP